mmetsp:Transcript_97221/g.275431  ORF Transcript_97221/g.275431 Transcript_97221/m.275431 type:complete len:498 (-) Transcript_97221:473-1966(-)
MRLLLRSGLWGLPRLRAGFRGSLRAPARRSARAGMAAGWPGTGRGRRVLLLVRVGRGQRILLLASGDSGLLAGGEHGRRVRRVLRLHGVGHGWLRLHLLALGLRRGLRLHLLALGLRLHLLAFGLRLAVGPVAAGLGAVARRRASVCSGGSRGRWLGVLRATLQPAGLGDRPPPRRAPQPLLRRAALRAVPRPPCALRRLLPFLAASAGAAVGLLLTMAGCFHLLRLLRLLPLLRRPGPGTLLGLPPVGGGAQALLPGGRGPLPEALAAVAEPRLFAAAPAAGPAAVASVAEVLRLHPLEGPLAPWQRPLAPVEPEPVVRQVCHLARVQPRVPAADVGAAGAGLGLHLRGRVVGCRPGRGKPHLLPRRTCRRRRVPQPAGRRRGVRRVPAPRGRRVREQPQAPAAPQPAAAAGVVPRLRLHLLDWPPGRRTGVRGEGPHPRRRLLRPGRRCPSPVPVEGAAVVARLRLHHRRRRLLELRHSVGRRNAEHPARDPRRG